MKYFRLISLCLALALLAGCAPTGALPPETQKPDPTRTPQATAEPTPQATPAPAPEETAEPAEPEPVIGSGGIGRWPGDGEPSPTPEPTPFIPAAGAPKPLSAPLVDLPPIPAVRTDGGEAGYAAFAAELLRRCREEGKSTLVSPLSVVLALGMTANGAGGATLEEFETLFGTDLDTLNGLCAAMHTEYAALGGSTQSNLVNSLWADPELVLEDDFVARCQQTFGAELFNADLQSPETVNAVNAWVNNATRGMIPQIVDRFDRDAVLALINAVYLKNKFERPFEEPSSKWTLTFTAEDGTQTNPYGMRNGTRKEQYIAADNGRGVVLPYDDGRLGLLLMLPEEGLTMTEYLAGWDGGTVKALLDARQEVKVSLTMPKFKTDWSSSLTDILKDMGLTAAFDENSADFDPMGRTVKDEPLYIGDVIHKTAFEVNEKGTEAAAVTAVIMFRVTSVMPVEQIIELRLDRPFVYGIVDLETGSPLFLGTLETVPDGE